jgi:hypothetical protein
MSFNAFTVYQPPAMSFAEDILYVLRRMHMSVALRRQVTSGGGAFERNPKSESTSPAVRHFSATSTVSRHAVVDVIQCHHINHTTLTSAPESPAISPLMSTTAPA